MVKRLPRVRFAPSPTGYLHVGGARTALFNYLFARHSGGSFLLRIEDTDRERSSDEMTRQIVEAMAWLGLEVDEPPAHQADGLSRHREDVQRLIDAGAAYRCWARKEELDAMREDTRARNVAFRYLRHPAFDADEERRREAAGEPYAVFFAVPEGATTFDDVVHGPTTVAHDSLDDFIVLRSDGTPVYNMAVVSDDIDMGITHVIRGDDHLSNTPKQILIYRALATEPPTFAHVPMILGPDGRRLSKRHGAASVEAYRGEGILPEALVNFLALLGWSPGDDRELMRMDELVEAFTLERILKKSAVFDAQKLAWLNGKYLDMASAERLVPMVLEAMESEGRALAAAEPERFMEIVELQKTRARTVGAIAETSLRYLAEPVAYDPAAVAKHWKDFEQARARLLAAREVVESVATFDRDRLEAEFRDVAARMEVGLGKVVHPLRVAVLGVADSPGIFDVLVLLGRDRALRRVRAALEWIEGREGGEPRAVEDEGERGAE